jgi:hypothetical protein
MRLKQALASLKAESAHKDQIIKSLQVFHLVIKLFYLNNIFV